MFHNFRRNESTSNAISSRQKCLNRFGDSEKITVRHEAAGISMKKKDERSIADARS